MWQLKYADKRGARGGLCDAGAGAVGPRGPSLFSEFPAGSAPMETRLFGGASLSVFAFYPFQRRGKGITYA